MNLSHILVKNQYEAEDLLKKIGESSQQDLAQAFSGLAMKFSQCPSGKSGGNLGKIALSRLVSEFSEAAKTLQVGQMSGIVRTQFGYHLILRND